MASLNACHHLGNLTRDPELRYTPKGTAVCEFSLAINSSYKPEGGERIEKVSFLDFTAWGRQAEIVSEYCKKGKQLYVGSRAEVDTWDDKETGKKRSKVKFIVEDVQLLGDGRGEVKAPKGPVADNDDIPGVPGSDDSAPPF